MHLTMIQNYCGLIPKKLIKSSGTRKIYFDKNYTLKRYVKEDIDLKDYLKSDIEDDNIVDFILMCLKTNPKHRATIKQLLSHKIFEDLKSIKLC